MPRPDSRIEYRAGVIALIIQGLSMPVIVYKIAGWDWAVCTASLLSASVSVGSLVFIVRLRRRQSAEWAEIHQRVVLGHGSAGQGAIRRMPEGDRRSRPVFEAREGSEEPSPQLIPGKTEFKKISLKRISPPPEPPPPTAWERIISAKDEESGGPG